MDYLSATLYGIIQGLTEFLPISSSGHLALLPKILKIEDPGVAFDLMMHVGTALSVIVYFRKTLLSLITHLIPSLFAGWGSQSLDKVEDKFLFLNRYLIVATLSTLPLIVVMKGIAGTFGRGSVPIGVNLILFGLFMVAADHFCKQNAENIFSKNKGYLAASWIGLAQSMAIFPGVSRSGVTLTMGRILGLNRQDATEFSFLLSLPIIIGGALEKAPAILLSHQPFPWMTCLFGVVVSFIVGLAAIHFFIKIVGQFGLWVFALYRVILGLAVLILL